ncbi:MAG: phage holin family protein [Candidatus Nomurabacteria bacterium]|jgi:putative membrane protein|nr:phage holin family protein [Candidatus Nomurabacteria bacterium]
MTTKLINRESISSFLVRWVSCSVGLWISVSLFGNKTNADTWLQSVLTYLGAGLIFSAVNAVLRTALVSLSMPFILLTLGLLMLLINGFLVWLTIVIAPHIEMSFGYAIISSFVISLVNYIVSLIIGFKSFSKTSNGGDKK